MPIAIATGTPRNDNAATFSAHVMSIDGFQPVAPT